MHWAVEVSTFARASDSSAKDGTEMRMTTLATRTGSITTFGLLSLQIRAKSPQSSSQMAMKSCRPTKVKLMHS